MELKVFTNSLAWVAFVASLPFIGMAVFALQNSVRGRPSTERVRQAGGSVFLNQWIMEYGYWWLRTPVRLLIRFKVSPSTITLAGLAMVTAGAALCAMGYFGLGGPVILVGSLTDMLDGVVAREMGICSDAGEFVDSMADRYADIIILGGLGIYYGSQPAALLLVLLALLGSVVVSYARAKAESFGIEDSPFSPMRRAERAVYLGFSMLFAPAVAMFTESSATRPVYYLTLAACAMIGVITNYSGIQMSLHACERLDQLKEQRS